LSSGELESQFSLFDIEGAADSEKAGEIRPKGRFSNFVVYVDESGDHGMQSLDPTLDTTSSFSMNMKFARRLRLSSSRTAKSAKHSWVNFIRSSM